MCQGNLGMIDSFRFHSLAHPTLITDCVSQTIGISGTLTAGNAHTEDADFSSLRTVHIAGAARIKRYTRISDAQAESWTKFIVVAFGIMSTASEVSRTDSNAGAIGIANSVPTAVSVVRATISKVCGGYTFGIISIYAHPEYAKITGGTLVVNSTLSISRRDSIRLTRRSSVGGAQLEEAKVASGTITMGGALSLSAHRWLTGISRLAGTQLEEAELARGTIAMRGAISLSMCQFMVPVCGRAMLGEADFTCAAIGVKWACVGRSENVPVSSLLELTQTRSQIVVLLLRSDRYRHRRRHVDGEQSGNAFEHVDV
jgi:hypothetical protein